MTRRKMTPSLRRVHLPKPRRPNQRQVKINGKPPHEKRIEEIRERLQECDALCERIGLDIKPSDMDFLLSQLGAAQKLADERLKALRPFTDEYGKRLNHPMVRGNIPSNAQYVAYLTYGFMREAKRLVDQADEGG